MLLALKMCMSLTSSSPVSPFAGIRLETVGNSRCQRARRGRHQVAVGVCHVSPFHRNKLSNNPEEGLLKGHCDTDEDFCRDESVHILSSRADNRADQSDNGADDEKPG